MDVDSEAQPATKHGKKRAEKRGSKKSSIVFPKYKDRVSKRRK